MMRSLTTLLGLAALRPVMGLYAQEANCSFVTCTPSTGAAHIIITRASTEALGPGILYYVAEDIIGNCSGSDYDYNPCTSEYPVFLLINGQHFPELELIKYAVYPPFKIRLCWTPMSSPRRKASVISLSW